MNVTGRTEWIAARREEGGLTAAELVSRYGKYGMCEACEQFTAPVCDLGHNVKRIPMIDGPNEEAHVPKKACPDYRKVETEHIVNMAGYWAEGVSSH